MPNLRAIIYLVLLRNTVKTQWERYALLLSALDIWSFFSSHFPSLLPFPPFLVRIFELVARLLKLSKIWCLMAALFWVEVIANGSQWCFWWAFLVIDEIICFDWLFFFDNWIVCLYGGYCWSNASSFWRLLLRMTLSFLWRFKLLLFNM